MRDPFRFRDLAAVAAVAATLAIGAGIARADARAPGLVHHARPAVHERGAAIRSSGNLRHGDLHEAGARSHRGHDVDDVRLQPLRGRRRRR